MNKVKNLEEIKKVIREEILIERLELEDIEPAEIGDDLPLFSEDGLGLDSVEALDIIAGLEQLFQVKFDGISEGEFRTHLYSVGTLATFVFEQQTH